MAFDDPTAAEQAFYAAFRALDNAGMRKVWSDSLDASCIHPGGPLIQGSADILASWRAIFSNAAAPRVAYRVLQTHADGRLAVHTVEEQVRSTSSEAVVIATNVYVDAGSGWHLLAHHASLPLVERSHDAPDDPPAALH